MNISQRYILRRRRRDACEDLHFMVTGPVVAHLQRIFVEDWFIAGGGQLEGNDYFPEISPNGPSVCRGIASGPDQYLGNIHWVILGAIAAATRRIDICTPYFVPTAALLSAMSMAAMRGVRIRLFLPSFVDLPFMKYAADAYLWQVLMHGVEVYHRQPPFVHTKLMLVDDHWTLLGSANFDRRSFRLNFEFNVEVYDPELSSGLAKWIDGLVSESVRTTLEAVDARTGLQRFRDGCVKLFSPHL